MCLAYNVETMRIVAYPLGDIDMASSRYRVYWPTEELGGRKFAVASGEENWKQSTIVFFQRTCSAQHVDMAKRAANTGKFVVYDCTDFYWRTVGVDKLLSEHERAMIRQAHLLTCCNEDDAWLLNRTFNKPVRVLPNMQKLSLYVKCKSYKETPSPVLIWMGYGHNIRTLKSIWRNLRELCDEGIKFSLLLINGDGVAPALDFPRPIKAMAWSRKDLGDLLTSGDVLANPQVKCDYGRYYKDNNKTVTARAHGLAVASFDEVDNWTHELRVLLTDFDYRHSEGEYGRILAKGYDVSILAPKWWDILMEEYAWWKLPS